MRNLLFIITLVFNLTVITSQVKAECPTGNVELLSQAAVNTFVAEHAACNTIPGDLKISGNDITDLSGLSFITNIIGKIDILDNNILTNLTGLDNVTFIGESLNITGNTMLTTCQASGLCSFVSTCGTVAVANNASGCNDQFDIKRLCFNPENALNFDGVDDIVLVPSSPSLDINSDQMTMEFWVKLTELPSEISGDFSYIYGSTDDSYIFYLDKANSELRFKLTDEDGTTERPGIYEGDLTVGTWHHIAAVYYAPQGIVLIYLDGNQKDSHKNVNLTDDNVKTGQVATFGGKQGSTMEQFSGAIDEIRIWSDARTVSEISDNMNSDVSPQSANLLAYWRANQGASEGDNSCENVLIDYTGNANHASLQNFDLSGGSSNWVVAIPAILPIELTHFSGVPTDRGVTLNWQTAIERNNDGFDIERSADGSSWKTIDFVEGFGTSDTEKNYTYNDNFAQEGINYYRLKQIDYDGAFTYSEMISITKKATVTGIQLYPNPSRDIIFFSGNEQKQVQVYGISGQLMIEVITSGEQGISVSDLPNGQYFVQITGTKGERLSGQFQVFK